MKEVRKRGEKVSIANEKQEKEINYKRITNENGEVRIELGR